MTVRLGKSIILNLALLPVLALGLLACRAEPELNCERVRFGWPHFDESPSSDISSAEGIQIDIALRSDLLPGASATLSITAENVPEEERESAFAAEAVADAEGQLVFKDVTLSLGSLLFLVDAEDDCGKARAGRRTYVWDGLGKPQCVIALASDPDPDPESGSFELGPEDDEDSGTAGMQVRVLIDAGRSDMEVDLFVVDRETGTSESLELLAGENNLAEQSLTLAEGEQALRAICYWPGEDLYQTSPTQVYMVESSASAAGLPGHRQD